MKIVAVIPARYNSVRFQGKPLADIHGKPMIWWVYHQVKKVDEFADIYVATDDERISKVCSELDVPVIMTSNDHSTMSSRVHEFSEKVAADCYAIVNGDEPLIEPEVIKAVLPDTSYGFYASNLMAVIHSPADAIDYTNIKVVFDSDMNALFMSREPIPYPKSTLKFRYFKHLGVIAYSKKALDFYVSAQRGYYEEIEDIDYLRFIENRKPFKMIEVVSDSLSVDTMKDLEYVREKMKSIK